MYHLIEKFALYCIFDTCHCVLTQHLAKSESVQTLQSAKMVKKENLKVTKFVFGLNSLHLPNVLIHEPNEFIHVRKLKPTLKIQIHHSLVQKGFSLY